MPEPGRLWLAFEARVQVSLTTSCGAATPLVLEPGRREVELPVASVSGACEVHVRPAAGAPPDPQRQTLRLEILAWAPGAA
jgi:hypothetical protein